MVERDLSKSNIRPGIVMKIKPVLFEALLYPIYFSIFTSCILYYINNSICI